MLAIAPVLLISLLFGSAYAQTPSPSPGAGDVSSYCVSGSGGFLSSETQGIAEMRAKCRKGDTILIPGGSASVIARVCDFSRSMVAVGGVVICVITGGERGRR